MKHLFFQTSVLGLQSFALYLVPSMYQAFLCGVSVCLVFVAVVLVVAQRRTEA